MDVAVDLSGALRQYWGYDGFRPLQEQIVRSLLDGQDVAVVMPTGGGKSLCYQLPAIVSGGTAIVISPLISLMHDQAAHLKQMGIPSAILNSTQTPAEQTAVMREALQGAYRLLYLSPERLARPDTVHWLQRVPISFFAIDEAHCISEWGHEFRPEYRQLSALRHHFPDKPIAAFTASATQRVRHDILHQLKLHEPRKFIVSFHRPNLRYLVRETDARSQSTLLMSSVRAHDGSSLIIYAPTIAKVHDTVDLLLAKKIDAVPYHGQMESGLRQRNQELWMSDEVRVLVGTLAFGLGINKPAVRSVIHLALPKSIEQYYQEAGRAGRDSNPADCVLLWQKRDVGLLVHFIEQLKDKKEKEAAWERYHAIRRFVDTRQCRHRQVCLHFGETPKWERCEQCDVCGNEPDWMSAPLSSAARVLTKAARKSVSSTPKPAADPTIDPELREYLREWRRNYARESGLPTFFILNDASLEDLCRQRPRRIEDLLHIVGIGERKAELYGEAILGALLSFERGDRVKVAIREIKETPADETLRLIGEGKTLAEVATLRERKIGTVITMVADLVEQGRLRWQSEWVSASHCERIEELAVQLGDQALAAYKQALPDSVTYDEIRLVLAKVRADRTRAADS